MTPCLIIRRTIESSHSCAGLIGHFTILQNQFRLLWVPDGFYYYCTVSCSLSARRSQRQVLEPNEMTETQHEPGEATLHMPMKEHQRDIEHIRDYNYAQPQSRQGNGICDPPQTQQSFIRESASREVVSLMAISFPVILSLSVVPLAARSSV